MACLILPWGWLRMRTNFNAQLLATSRGARANEILRSCVHCGFCNATCPTYQLTGDELDGPRGRIYLINELLENGSNQQRAQQHLDRCLTCRACETTCPSGVAYGELADIARAQLGPQRNGVAGLLRSALQWVVPYPSRMRPLVRLGRWFRWMLPKRLSDHLPGAVGRPVLTQAPLSSGRQGPRVLLLNGCAQQVNTAETNQHLARLLVEHGVEVTTVHDETCCGSLDLHLGDHERGLHFARNNTDVLYPMLEQVDAIVSSASGCGVTLKEMGQLLVDDAAYAHKASAVSAKTKDVSEYLADCGITFTASRSERRVAWHAPCSLQHGQKITNVVENLLGGAGYELVTVRDSHLCCGSAGTYSVLQPQLSDRLKTDKIQALSADAPEVIATANVGCQTHLNSGSDIEVLHWIELLK